MNSILKIHSTLTGWVDENIKNLTPLKQIMINITIYRSKPRLRIFLGKKMRYLRRQRMSNKKIIYYALQQKPKI